MYQVNLSSFYLEFQYKFHSHFSIHLEDYRIRQYFIMDSQSPVEQFNDLLSQSSFLFVVCTSPCPNSLLTILTRTLPQTTEATGAHSANPIFALFLPSPPPSPPSAETHSSLHPSWLLSLPKRAPQQVTQGMLSPTLKIPSSDI